MKPTSYELLIQKNDQGLHNIQLRFYAAECVKGYCAIENHPYRTGKSLPSLRKQGIKMAAKFGVKFIDRTV